MADGLELRLTGLDGVLEQLRQLPAEVVSKRGGVVKSALRKGAVVLFKQAKANLQVATANQADAEQRTSTGLLIKNLVVTRGKPPTSGNGERYLVRVRRKSYAREGGEVVTTLKTAQLLEYGSSQQPAEPWLRPALNSKAREAISTVEAEMIKGIERALKRLQRSGR